MPRLVAFYLREFSGRADGEVSWLYKFIFCLCLPFVSNTFYRARMIALALAECTESVAQIDRVLDMITASDSSSGATISIERTNEDYFTVFGETSTPVPVPTFRVEPLTRSLGSGVGNAAVFNVIAPDNNWSVRLETEVAWVQIMKTSPITASVSTTQANTGNVTRGMLAIFTWTDAATGLVLTQQVTILQRGTQPTAQVIIRGKALWAHDNTPVGGGQVGLFCPSYRGSTYVSYSDGSYTLELSYMTESDFNQWTDTELLCYTPNGSRGEVYLPDLTWAQLTAPGGYYAPTIYVGRYDMIKTLQMAVYLTDKDTGDPVSGASVTISVGPENYPVVSPKSGTTDSTGLARIDVEITDAEYLRAQGEVHCEWRSTAGGGSTVIRDPSWANGVPSSWLVIRRAT